MKLAPLSALLFLTQPLLASDAQDAPGPHAAETQAAEFSASELWERIAADIALFYAYREGRGFDDQAYFDRLKGRLLETTSVEEFRRELHASTFAFTDPHFIVGPFEDSDFNIFPTASDLFITYSGGTYRVQDVRAASPAYAAGVRPGWEILACDGTAIGDAAAQIYAGRIDTPNAAQLGYGATLIANGKRSGQRQLQFRKPDGNVIDLELLSPRDFAKTVSEMEPLELDYPVEGVARLRINNALGNNAILDDLDAFFDALPELKGFILDLRNTPSGGNTTIAQSIMGHFVDAPEPYQIHDYPSMEREFGVPRRSIEVVMPRSPYFDVPLVVLASKWTGSMGEGITIGLDAAADAHVIASDMGDLLGGLSNFTYAENAVKVDMGTYKLSHMDGTPREDYVADVPLGAADTDAEGNDAALDAAIAYFKTVLPE